MASNRRLQLKNIRIASPCAAFWEDMYGDDQVRYCNVCSKSVYNLSAMTKAEAELLLHGMHGGFCARIYLRKDGSVMTADCPVGLARLRKLIVKRAAATAAVVLSLGAGIVTFIADRVLSAAIAKAVSAAASAYAVVMPLSAVKPVVQPLMGLVAPPMARDETPDAPVPITPDITAPVLKYKVTPDYPPGCLRFQGIAILEAVVGTSGEVSRVRVLRSLVPEIDQRAVEAVRQWRYTPAMCAGKPVSVLVTITVRYHVR